MSRYSKFLLGSPVLLGDNTVPGLKLPKELEDLLPVIFKVVRDYGCDYYPTVVQKLTYDEISEVAAYGGFPVRYPHWKFGMEYEQLQRGYEHNNHKIYEMVINNNPCWIYCLDSNSLVDDVTVVAHALGHNDFFKNNIYFSQTNRNMMNEFANHGTSIRKYMSRWGREKVTEFIDHVLRVETLIDPAKAWEKRKYKSPILTDSRKWRHPKRIPVQAGHDYMEPYINPKEWREKQLKKIEREDAADQLDIFKEPTKDVLGFIRDNAPLKPWQADIVSMLYEESIYFAPQRMTKVCNEGWASFMDYEIMARQGFASLGQKEGPSAGIIEYAVHKAGVLGGKYSVNPYKLGFSLLLDIEERWNKGRFGSEYDDCENLEEKENWDKKLGLGKEKVFEVRKNYNDLMLIMEFFTPEFCEKNEWFEYKHFPCGETRIESRDHKKIKKQLIDKYTNGGLPDIRLVDPNHKGKGYLFLEHTWEGRTLYDSYVRPVLTSLRYLWNNDIYLSTRDNDGKEFIYFCVGNTEDDVDVMSRENYLKQG